MSEAKKDRKLSDAARRAVANGCRKRWALMSDEERENFRKKMTEVNNSEDKIKRCSDKLKARWADPVRRKKII